MWLATQHGFYSIVQKPAGQFHVRTRCKQDLENLISLAAIDAPCITREHTTIINQCKEEDSYENRLRNGTLLAS
jgi:hypothetical protein